MRNSPKYKGLSWNFQLFTNWKLDNLETFVKNGLKWIQHHNLDVNINSFNFSKSSLALEKELFLQLVDNDFPFKKRYTYPDSDLCLYKDFPHQRLVYPILDVNNNTTCTCSIIWLVQFSKIFYKNSDYTEMYADLNITDLTVQHCLSIEKMHNYAKRCNFEGKFQKNCHDKKDVQINSYTQQFANLQRRSHSIF